MRVNDFCFGKQESGVWTQMRQILYWNGILPLDWLSEMERGK